MPLCSECEELLRTYSDKQIKRAIFVSGLKSLFWLILSVIFLVKAVNYQPFFSLGSHLVPVLCWATGILFALKLSDFFEYAYEMIRRKEKRKENLVFGVPY